MSFRPEVTRWITPWLFGFGMLGATLSPSSSQLAAADELPSYAPLDPELIAVPQNLLKLVHTAEVQKELGLDENSRDRWEESLRKVDAVWWPSRILPTSEQRQTVAKQEAEFLSSVEAMLGATRVARLRQIELQSQGVRMLVRPEVEKFVRLDVAQRSKLIEIFKSNDETAAATATAKSPADADKLKATAKNRADEPKRVLALLTKPQSERVRLLVGEPFDTSDLARIYPLAPELLDSGYWSGADRVTLESLRGNVVLVHFYAFQCHNCVANFAHYKRWDETLRKKDVRLIGIQTPETEAERDPVKVKAAAEKQGFQFPVLIDVQSKNWDAWGNTMWPTVYVIDKQGYIRFWWQGELNWEGATVDKKIESIVDQLLKE